MYIFCESNSGVYGEDLKPFIYDKGLSTFVKVIDASIWNSSEKRFTKAGFTTTNKLKREAAIDTINSFRHNTIILTSKLDENYDTLKDRDKYVQELGRQLGNFQYHYSNKSRETNRPKIHGKVARDGRPTNDDLAICLILGNHLINKLNDSSDKLYGSKFFF